MLTKTTVVGIGAGSVITIIGIVAFFLSIGLQSEIIDETLPMLEGTVFEFNAPTSSYEFLNVTGSSFHIKIETPQGDTPLYQGLQIDNDFKDNTSFEWYGLVDGVHRIEIKNTGDSEVTVNGKLEFTNAPILFTFHILVIIAGIVIIGTSAGFSVKKPRGF